VNPLKIRLITILFVLFTIKICILISLLRHSCQITVSKNAAIYYKLLQPEDLGLLTGHLQYTKYKISNSGCTKMSSFKIYKIRFCMREGVGLKFMSTPGCCGVFYSIQLIHI
jgi:hypothetical protein